jgi:hypothetical protein
MRAAALTTVAGDSWTMLRDGLALQHPQTPRARTNDVSVIAALPITGYPAIVSRESYEQNGRMRIGLARATARLAGTDGRPGNKFSMESLREIVLSNRAYYADVARTGRRSGGDVRR